MRPPKYVLLSALLLVIANACAMMTNRREGDSCGEGADETRRRCFIEALVDCRKATIETANMHTILYDRIRFEVVPGVDGNCEALIEYFDLEGNSKGKERCGALSIALENFELGPVLGRCWPLASD